MKSRICLSLLTAATLATFAAPAPAHGGQYTGPQDVVPPSPGSGGGRGPAGPKGPTTGQPNGPIAPGPSGPFPPGGPVTGGPRPIAGPGARGGRSTGGFGPDEVDLTTWDLWWELNRHPYLSLKDAVHDGGTTTGLDDLYLGGTRRRTIEGLKPTREQIQQVVLPTLRRAIDATDNRDITSSCLVAMAKIGEDHPEFALVDVFKPRLRRPDQEIRETAALALGIAARIGHAELDLLAGLALDDGVGRAAYGGEVDVRTRSFALHGLGLVGAEHRDPAVKERVFAVASRIVDDRTSSERNLKVAAIHALGLLEVGASEPAERRLRDAALKTLGGYLAQDLGAGEALMQAHCPTAIAKLVHRDAAAAAPWKDKFAAILRGDGGKSGTDLARSCALALGRLCGPYDDKTSPDAASSQLLVRTFADHRDAQTRYFAVLALGQIGGRENRAFLLEKLRTANRVLERPWCALALGVMARDAAREDRAAGRDVVADTEIGEALMLQLEEAKEPGYVSALGIALGLVQHRAAESLLLQKALADAQKEKQAGYLVLAVGMLGDRAAVPELRKLLDASARRPELLRQTATALGLLGDKGVADQLLVKLTEERTNVATFAALSAALGQIGDCRSIAPLQKLLLDESRAPLTRAFAAVALGGIADRAKLPWHVRIASDLNYRASVETLINSQSGILDIL
ncbi:MAG: HEAT repeat domain-containing protein [Planctomycetes bacterium]|nr:HEAT repeat domain-containing protein [Planctomycetota bacterium]